MEHLLGTWTGGGVTAGPSVKLGSPEIESIARIKQKNNRLKNLKFIANNINEYLLLC